MSLQDGGRGSLLPPRPRLVLRCGFAGSRRLLPDDEARSDDLQPQERAQVSFERSQLERALPQVLQVLGKQICGIIPPKQEGPKVESNVLDYFSGQTPLLRMITGLCEGADAIAGQALERLEVSPTQAPGSGARQSRLDTELAAVLPFDIESYRASRPAWFQAEFDRQLKSCAWVLALDGIYDKPMAAELAQLPESARLSRQALAENRRSRAYRAQGTFLLRHCDILIAAVNPDHPGKAGGTLETVRQALDFELPVIFIHTGLEGDNVFVVDPNDDLFSALANPPPTPEVWQATLGRWIKQLTIDPDSGLSPEQDHDEAREHGRQLLAEFFDEPQSPPRQASGKRHIGLRERTWTWFERRFRKGPQLRSEPPLLPFSDYRERATDLNYHYSGQYRGAFLLNYGLAVVAVLFAAASLALLGTAANTAVGVQVSNLLRAAGQLPEPHAKEHKDDCNEEKSPRWLLPVLLALTLAKLGIVIFISKNTRRANLEKWNDRAVDYRYLAERLRGMLYLARAGSHQPPTAKPSQFASRVLQQSTIDWLFDTIVRAISPADLPSAESKTIPPTKAHGELKVNRLITLSPNQVLQMVQENWIAEQTKYHDRNFRTMNSINHWCESLATRLGWIVIVVVALDLLLIGGKVLHWLPHDWVDFAKAATPWLIFISAVLPAIIAALGGVRFQSECQRLAERSAVMRSVLGGAQGKHGYLAQASTLGERIRIAQASPETDLGSWSLSVLQLTELVAADFVHEAAEWSVLYAKEVADPG